MFFQKTNYNNYFLIIDAQNNRGVITRVLTIFVEFELQNTQSPTKGFEFGSIPCHKILKTCISLLLKCRHKKLFGGKATLLNQTNILGGPVVP